MARIGINGFGRIGRYLVRLMAERNEFPVVINARADNASLAHLFKYDSVHHTFKGTVGHDENGIIINGTHIAVTRCKPNEWQWKDYGVDLVVESTGTSMIPPSTTWFPPPPVRRTVSPRSPRC